MQARARFFLEGIRSSLLTHARNYTGESFEQPPAKLFLLTEYCYFDPTVLKKRSIRCIPCKMSLSKMVLTTHTRTRTRTRHDTTHNARTLTLSGACRQGWKQHMLSTVHVEKKAKFNARGQSPQQTAELVYRSAGGGLTCLACAVLLLLVLTLPLQVDPLGVIPRGHALGRDGHHSLVDRMKWSS